MYVQFSLGNILRDHAFLSVCVRTSLYHCVFVSTRVYHHSAYIA